MKSLKKQKIIFSIILFFLFSFTIFSPVLAAGDIVSKGDDFIKKGEEGSVEITDESIKGVTDSLYNVFLVIGITIAVIVGIILGVQFMIGSVEQKSKVKESIIPYIAGCAAIFGGFGIWKLVIEILKGL